MYAFPVFSSAGKDVYYISLALWAEARPRLAESRTAPGFELSAATRLLYFRFLQWQDKQHTASYSFEKTQIHFSRK